MTSRRLRDMYRRPLMEALESRAIPAVFTVVNLLGTATGSGNSGSLRYCIGLANSTPGADTIQFSVTGNITLVGTQLTVSDTTGATTISGPGANLLTISGSFYNRVIQINANVTVNIDGVTLTKGNSGFNSGGGGISNSGRLTVTNSSLIDNTGGGGGGGAIFNDRGATLTVTNVLFRNNSSTSHGGGLKNGIGIGKVAATVTDCTFEGNIAKYYGGGLDNYFATITITNSAFLGNSAYTGGGITNDGTLTVADTTLSGNSSSSDGCIRNGSGRTATILNSSFVGNTSGQYGGGFSNYGTLTVANSTVCKNSAAWYGGGIYNTGTLTISSSIIAGNTSRESGGGVSNTGTLSVASTTLSENSTAKSGGGIQNSGNVTVTLTAITGNSASDGGGINNGGTLTVVTSTIGHNSAVNGGGVNNEGSLFVTDSGILANVATNPIQFIPYGGGGIRNRGSVTVANTTLSNNSAFRGGGILNFGTLTVMSSTLSGNSANTTFGNAGGGISNYAMSFTAINTIVAGNTGGDVGGTLSGSSANNLLNMSAAAAGLGTLGSYGGPTQTFPLLPGSPAIDAGGSTTISTDQRGQPRVGAPDIGAFESQGFSFATIGSGQSAIINTKFANPLTITVTANNPVEPVDGGVVTFTSPVSGPSAVLSASTVTIVDGKVAVTATANDVPGAFLITGSSGHTSVGFSLTNLIPIVYGPINLVSLQLLSGSLAVTFNNLANSIELVGQAGLVTIRSNNSLVGNFAVTGNITINAGSASDTITVSANPGQSLPGNVTVNAGGGNDIVRIGSKGTAPGTIYDLTTALGEGNNQVVDLGANVSGNWTVTAGSGNDTVGPLTSPVNGTLNMNLGNGINAATVLSNVGGQLRYNGGGGTDNLTLGGTHTYYLYALMGAGNDTVTFLSGSTIGGGFIDFGLGTDMYVPNGVLVGSGLTLLGL